MIQTRVKTPNYQPPCLLELGKAETLVRNSGPGPVRDYSYGWYAPRI